MGKTKIILSILILTFTISCNLKKWDCEFSLFEKLNEVPFPKDVNIIECSKSRKNTTWIYIKLDKDDINSFISKSNMHKYSDEIKDSINDAEKLLGPDDYRTIKNADLTTNNKYKLSNKTENLYIVRKMRQKLYLTYVIDIETGELFGEIYFPELNIHL